MGVRTTWRANVENPDWFRRCRCKHAEQMHERGGACTAGPSALKCICDQFVEAKREWVGKGTGPDAA